MPLFIEFLMYQTHQKLAEFMKNILSFPIFVQDLQQKSIFILAMEDRPKWQLMKELCLNQNAEFKQWGLQKDFQQFHYSHYDWWAFPINRRSSYGDKYKLFPEDKDILEKDEEFIAAIRSNSILVCLSWGYDLQSAEEIVEKSPGQGWQDWPIRLYKMTNTLEYFGQMDLFYGAVKFGLHIIAEKDPDFCYGPKDLKPLFLSNKEKMVKYFANKKQDYAKVQSKGENIVLIKQTNAAQKEENHTKKAEQLANLEQMIASLKVNEPVSHKY